MRLIREPEVEHKTGLTHSRLYEEISQGRFPQQIRIGVRAVAWHEEEVDRWIEQRIAESRGTAAS